MRRAGAIAILTFVVLSVMAGVAAAAEQCHVHEVAYGQTWCNINDWCWFFWGQLWTERTTTYHCTRDGGQTWYDKTVHDHIKGNCCSV